MNNWEHTVFSLGEDFPMFELKYDWSRRFQFEFEWIELTIVDNKLGRNGQLAGDWEGKVGKRIPSRSCSPASLKSPTNFLQRFSQKTNFIPNSSTLRKRFGSYMYVSLWCEAVCRSLMDVICIVKDLVLSTTASKKRSA